MGVDNGRGANPFDDGWEDDGWDLYDDGSDDGYWPSDDESVWADAELDGHVRQRLATLVPLHHEAFDQWDEMQPRMTRARRRRHAAQALATSVLVAAVALVGLQGAGRFLPDDTSVVQAADGGDDMSTSDSQRPMVGIGEASSTIAADGDTATHPSGDGTKTPGDDPADGVDAPPGYGPATDTPAADETSLPGAPGSVVGSSAPVNGGSAASSVSIPPPTANTPTTASPVTNSPTVRSTTTTRATTSTSRATTTTTRAATTTSATSAITVRDFSTIDVTVRGSEIRLVAVHNGPGVTSQVHNSGPEKIEITFIKGSEKHDLVATVRNGNVVTSIVDSGDD